ncbi:squalene epoxidase-domain-containing protein [Podospora aff. communis PSN243]|uniref:squalene monooxygenase n=1 Tax=Podospora aff. communis PSN243 TaxID=3040156 RepID=A0AAV9GG63_9PEZI|nr:squalene epoxidase-domain-containing protein [Podospora aff. communis PSN243]
MGRPGGRLRGIDGNGKSLDTPQHEIIIVGAGIAGSAAAVAFARQGRQVLLLERSLKEPDRIVGELLQPGGVNALSELGLADCIDGIDATPIEGYHLYWKDQQASFWFCDIGGTKPEGRSFHHGKFVSKLRQAASAYTNVTLLEATVVEIVRDGNSNRVAGVACASPDGQRTEFLAPLTILADGSNSNFRSQFTPYRPKAQSRFWGLEMADAKLPIPRYAHAVLGRGPPVLMYPISSHDVGRVLPIVPTNVRQQLSVAIENGRLGSMPNAWMPSTKNTTPGLVTIGDASNMRHPVTGAGMTVALKDAILLAEILNPVNARNLQNVSDISKRMSDFHWKRKGHSASLNILAQALYLLFVSQDPALQIMQRGFIRYVQDGEKNFAEAAWIMGGLPIKPWRLFYHFISVAVYSIRLHLREASWRGLLRSVLFGGLGWVSSPNTRATNDILFDNFLALFVCVWTVLHHNLQAKHEGFWSVFWRKFRWAVLAVTAPEMLTLFAVMQWNAGNISVREMRSIGVESWSKVHAFYANAGGFVLETPGFPRFPINATSIYYHFKADLLAKGFAFTQAEWVILQICARAAQDLTITPLELFTAAFIVPSLATVYFWASKPQNVAEPTIIKVEWPISELLIAAGDAAKDPYVDTPMDFVEKPVWEGWRRLPSLLHYGAWVVSVVHALIHVLGWWFPFPTPIEAIIWRASSLTLLVVMAIGGVVPVISTQPWFDFSFSMLWIWVREAKRQTWVRRRLFSTVVDIAYVLYIIARIFILVEIFLVFRAMSEDLSGEVVLDEGGDVLGGDGAAGEVVLEVGAGVVEDEEGVLVVGDEHVFGDAGVFWADDGAEEDFGAVGAGEREDGVVGGAGEVV